MGKSNYTDKDIQMSNQVVRLEENFKDVKEKIANVETGVKEKIQDLKETQREQTDTIQQAIEEGNQKVWEELKKVNLGYESLRNDTNLANQKNFEQDKIQVDHEKRLGKLEVTVKELTTRRNVTDFIVNVFRWLGFSGTAILVAGIIFAVGYFVLHINLLPQ